VSEGPWVNYSQPTQDAPAPEASGPWESYKTPDKAQPDKPMSLLEEAAVPFRSAAAGLNSVNEGVYNIASTAAAALGSKGQGSWTDYFRQQADASHALSDKIEGKKADSWLGQQIQSSFRSVGMAAPGIASAILAPEVAGPAALYTSIAPGAIVQGGDSVRKATDEGASPLHALTYGFTDAAAEVAFERLPLTKLLKDVQEGTGIGKTLLHQIITEVPSEVATTLFQNLNEYTSLHPDKSFMDFLKEQPAAIRDTVVQTLIMSGTMTGGAKAVQHVAGKFGAEQIPETGPDKAQADALAATPIATPNAKPATGVQMSPEVAAALAAVRAKREGPRAPVTEQGNAPATEAPATEAPATEAPATEAPATEAPATEAPADQNTSGDTQETVPESPDTLTAQNASMLDPASSRRAVYIPAETIAQGNVDLPTGARIASYRTPDGGLIFWNRKKIDLGARAIAAFYKDGSLGKLLGLGDFTKADVAQSAAQGNTPVAVTERTPNGTEVKAAAGTTETAPDQLAALTAQKDAGNTVQVESPAAVLNARVANQDITANVDTPPVSNGSVLSKMTPEQIAAIEARYSKPATAAPVANAPVQGPVSTPAQAPIPLVEEQKPAETSLPVETPKAEEPKVVVTPEGKRQIFLPTTQETKDLIDEQAFREKRADIDRQVAIQKSSGVIAEKMKVSRDAADAGKFASVSEEVAARTDPSSHNKARDKARLEKAIKADKLLKEMVPEKSEDVRTNEGLYALFQRFEKITKAALKAKIDIKAEVSGVTSNAEAWLAQVRETRKKLNKLAQGGLSPGARSDILLEIEQFLSAEHELRTTGNSTPMRDIRREVGSQLITAAPASESEDGGDPMANVVDENTMTPEEALIAKQEGESDLNDTSAQNSTDFMEQAAPKDITEPGNEPDIAGIKFTDKGVPVVEQKAMPKVETIKKRVIVKPGEKAKEVSKARSVVTPESNVREMPRDNVNQEAPMVEKIGNEGKYAEETLNVSQVYDRHTSVEALDAALSEVRGFSLSQRVAQTSIAKAIFGALKAAVGDVKVLILSDENFDRFQPFANAYYSKSYDQIVIRRSALDNAGAALHLVIHETAHAALEHAIDANPVLAKQLDDLRVSAARVASREGLSTTDRGFKNVHEFASEVLANPAFQELLSNMPMSRGTLAMNGITAVPATAKIRTAWDWVKATLNQVLGIYDALGGKPSNFSASMDVVGNLLELSQRSRSDFYTNEAAKTETVRESPKEPKTTAEKLQAYGIEEAKAKELATALEESFGDTITPDELDAVVAAFSRPVTTPFVAPPAVSSAKANPVIYTGNQPPMTPRLANILNNAPRAEGGHTRGWRLLLLGGMSLDYIDRTYRSYFPGAKSNAMTDYVNAALEHDAVRAKIEDVHYRDYASYAELQRTDPEEAAKIAAVVAELSAVDVNLGPNADNKHLIGNARDALQAKARLPAIEQIYNTMNPGTKKILHDMADHYRDSFNDYIRAVAYRIVSEMDTKLSNSDLVRIVDHTVEGKLDDQDKADIKNDILFDALKRSKNLRTRKGMYFPSMRFGDVVVQTKVKVADPKITHVVTKSGRKRVPVSTKVEDNKVSFMFDHSIRGSRGAVARAINSWIASHDLTLLDHSTKYRDRVTGKLVSKGDMDITHDHDTVVEITLQNEGLHYFESQKEAEKFHAQAQKDLAAGNLSFVKGVMTSHEADTRGTLTPGAITAVAKAVGGSDMSDAKKVQLEALLRTAVAMQLPGNRYEKRLLGRRAVIGQSTDVGRAAAQYGRQIGNALASVQSGHDRVNALEALNKLASEMNDSANGIRSDVLKELQKRENMKSGPLVNNQWENDLMTINSIDKLGSPASWMLNGTQVAMLTFNVLGGQFGFAESAKAVGSAYQRIGALTAVTTGLKNTGAAVTQWSKSEIDPDDPVASIRTNLGVKYKDLIDALVARHDIAEGVGIENAEQFTANRGVWGRSLSKVERIMRQMPNTIEAINRTTTAVASYDLARKNGMDHQEAIQYATDNVRRTQFRYDRVNRARWMNQNRAMKFFFTFKQFGFNSYQLIAEAAEKAFKGSSQEEKMIGAKQLAGVVLTQALVAGALAIPGMEAVKMILILGAALGLDDGWEAFVARAQKLAEEMAGKTGADVLTKGAVSTALGVDLSSRLSWSDLLTGYSPRSGKPADIYKYIGETMAGAPGGMLVDWATGIHEMGQATYEGDPGKFLTAFSKLVPIKIVSDSVKAAEGIRSGKMNAVDAAKQVIGFRSMRQAGIGDTIGNRIREGTAKSAVEKNLISDFLDATSPADIARATSAIRRYNAKLPAGKKSIGIEGLKKLRAKDTAIYR
jgi:hypothetical protein